MGVVQLDDIDTRLVCSANRIAPGSLERFNVLQCHLLGVGCIRGQRNSKAINEDDSRYLFSR